MKQRWIVLGVFFLVAIALDALMQFVLPGLSWLAIVVVLLAAVTSKDLHVELFPLLIMASIADLLSGMTIGIVTFSFALVFASLFISKRWLASNPSSPISVIGMSIPVALEFFAIIILLHGIAKI